MAGKDEEASSKDYVRARDLELRIESLRTTLAGKQALGIVGEEEAKLQDNINREVQKLQEVNSRLLILEEKERGRASAVSTATALRTPAKPRFPGQSGMEEEEKVDTATVTQPDSYAFFREEQLRLEALSAELQMKENQLEQRERDAGLGDKATFSKEEVTNLIRAERDARGRSVLEGNLLAISQSLADMRRDDRGGAGRGGRRSQKMLGRVPEFDSAQDDFLLHCRALNNYLTLNAVDDVQQKKLILVLHWIH